MVLCYNENRKLIQLECDSYAPSVGPVTQDTHSPVVLVYQRNSSPEGLSTQKKELASCLQSGLLSVLTPCCCTLNYCQTWRLQTTYIFHHTVSVNQWSRHSGTRMCGSGPLARLSQGCVLCSVISRFNHERSTSSFTQGLSTKFSWFFGWRPQFLVSCQSGATLRCVVLGTFQYGRLPHQSKQGWESVSRTKVMVSCNLIMDVASIILMYSFH